MCYFPLKLIKQKKREMEWNDLESGKFYFEKKTCNNFEILTNCQF